MAISSFTAGFSSGAADTTGVIPITENVPASSKSGGATILIVFFSWYSASSHTTGLSDTADADPSESCFPTSNSYYYLPTGADAGTFDFGGGTGYGGPWAAYSVIANPLVGGVDSVEIAFPGATDWVGVVRVYTGVRVNQFGLAGGHGGIEDDIYLSATNGPIGTLNDEDIPSEAVSGFAYWPNPDGDYELGPWPQVGGGIEITRSAFNSYPTPIYTFPAWQFVNTDLAIYFMCFFMHDRYQYNADYADYIGWDMSGFSWDDGGISTVYSALEHILPNVPSPYPGGLTGAPTSIFLGELAPTVDYDGDVGCSATYSNYGVPGTHDVRWSGGMTPLVAGAGPYCGQGLHIWRTF